MNVGTQTPRRLYVREADQGLQALIVQLEKLGKQNKARNSKENTQRKAATEGNWSNKIQIGPNGTQLSKKMYLKIDLGSHRAATRDLCNMIFGRRTLGTHTLTGREGPGTVCGNRKRKEQLEPTIVSDIVHHVLSLFDVQQAQVVHSIRLTCRNSARALIEKNK